MSCKFYENLKFQSEIYFILKQSEIEAEQTNLRYSHEKVMKEALQIIEESILPTFPS